MAKRKLPAKRKAVARRARAVRRVAGPSINAPKSVEKRTEFHGTTFFKNQWLNAHLAAEQKAREKKRGAD